MGQIQRLDVWTNFVFYIFSGNYLHKFNFGQRAMYIWQMMHMLSPKVFKQQGQFISNCYCYSLKTIEFEVKRFTWDDRSELQLLSWVIFSSWFVNQLGTYHLLHQTTQFLGEQKYWTMWLEGFLLKKCVLFDWLVKRWIVLNVYS